ncbi:SAM-dependent methyltransferase [Streptomyces sp. NPDC052040]|uniref:SAM-dependent methyltransferase n=1 Tax=Streptomyces sp. NPDC052040 TaxID=3365682 RepID=UPI0037CE7239
MENPSPALSGTGSTALVVAALRAVESARNDALFTDRLAAPLVRAAQLANPLPTSLTQVGEEERTLLGLAADGVALRTRYLDDYLTSSQACQVVIVAAGLDTRAFRLDGLSGCTVFELDQAPVLDFKQKALGRAGARPCCERRAVAADLREEWAPELVKAGFDPSLPSAWLMEGLLPYLPAAAEHQLFSTVHALSAPGSSIGVWATAEDTQSASPANERVGAMYAAYGIDITDIADNEPRQRITELLPSLGWNVTEGTLDELSERYRRPLSSSRRITFFTARNTF